MSRYATALAAMIVHMPWPSAAATTGTAMRNAASTTVLGPKTRRIPNAYGWGSDGSSSAAPSSSDDGVDEGPDTGGGGGDERGGCSETGGPDTGGSDASAGASGAGGG